MMLDAIRSAGDSGLRFDCLAIPTFARALGTGPPVVVLHGGPGFDHTYLVDPLRRLMERRTLIFYDQPGCGRSGGDPDAMSPDITFRHFRELLRQCLPGDGRAGLMAHSWGALVFAASEPASAGVRFGEGLLVAPVSFTRPRWNVALDRLMRRIPLDVSAAFLQSLHSPADMPLSDILQYYVASPASGLGDTDIRVRGRTYLAVSGLLGNFNYQSQAERSLGSIDLLLPTEDFTTPDLLGGAVSAAHAVHVVDSGHFPFLEAPDACARILDEVFR